MKSRFVLLSALVATTAGFGVATNALASPPDAQAHASATLDEHPAVLVARTWGTRGIDPNTFAVAHPAGLQLPAASPSAEHVQPVANALVTASTDTARSGR